jgi:hypothetical protein
MRERKKESGREGEEEGRKCTGRKAWEKETREIFKLRDH